MVKNHDGLLGSICLVRFVASFCDEFYCELCGERKVEKLASNNFPESKRLRQSPIWSRSVPRDRIVLRNTLNSMLLP